MSFLSWATCGVLWGLAELATAQADYMLQKLGPSMAPPENGPALGVGASVRPAALPWYWARKSKGENPSS